MTIYAFIKTELSISALFLPCLIREHCQYLKPDKGEEIKQQQSYRQ